MSAFYVSLSDEKDLPAQVLTSNPFLGWSTGNHAPDAIQFIKNMLEFLAAKPSMQERVWVRDLAAALLNKRGVNIRTSDGVVIERCAFTITLEPRFEQACNRVRMNLSVTVRVGFHIHYLCVDVTPVPSAWYLDHPCARLSLTMSELEDVIHYGETAWLFWANLQLPRGRYNYMFLPFELMAQCTQQLLPKLEHNEETGQWFLRRFI